MNQSSVVRLERSEERGAITLGKLREYAEALARVAIPRATGEIDFAIQLGSGSLDSAAERLEGTARRLRISSRLERLRQLVFRLRSRIIFLFYYFFFGLLNGVWEAQRVVRISLGENLVSV